MRNTKVLGLTLALAATVAAPAALPLTAWADDVSPAPTAQDESAEQGARAEQNVAPAAQDEPAAQPVAAALIEVNGVEYASLEDALAAIPADKAATIKLLGDVTIPNGMRLAIATDVTLLLNGHTLTSMDIKDRPLYVKSTGSITIDGTVAGSAVKIGDPASYGLLEADLGADVTLKGGTYSGDTENGCLFRVMAPAAGDTKVVLEDLTVETNYSVFKTSPYTIPSGSDFELQVKGGTYTTDGLSQIFYTDTIDRSPVTFEGVTANVNGGSCVVELAGSRGVFRDCTFAVNGTNKNNFSDTAVFVGFRGKATIESGTYTSKGHGAYIGTSGGEIEILGGTVQGDKGSIQADADGGSYKGAESIVTIKGGTIKGDLGGVTHGKATSSFTVTGGDISGGFVLKENGTGGDASASVSGGTFDRELPGDVCADGFAPSKNPDGTFGVAPAATTVALVTIDGVSAGYPTLEEAFASIPAGSSAVVKLVKDEDISDATAEISVPVDTDVRLDLGGKTLSAANNAALVSYGTLTICDSTDTDANGTGTGAIRAVKPYGAGYTSGIVAAKSGGAVVMESGLIDCSSAFAPNNTDKGQFGITVMNETADAKVVINGGKIVAGWYCVAGNGTNTTHDGFVIVNGGELVSTADYAIYSPQAGGVTIKGGSVTGAAGAVHIQRGSLDIAGGTLTSNGTGSTGDWGDGTGGSGNAVVNFAGKYGSVEGAISGGAFVAKGDAEMLHLGTKHPADVEVSGGVFNKPIPEDLLADGFGLGEPDANGNYVPHKHEWESKLSCDETGHWHACAKCDAKDSVQPHEESADLAGVVAPTCGADGYTGDKVCKDCGFVLKKGVVAPATGKHVSSDWIANNTDHWHVCDVCDKPYDVDAHSFGKWTIVKKATATENGVREHECSVCGKVVSEEIPALGVPQGDARGTPGDKLPGMSDKLPTTGDDALVGVAAASSVAVLALGAGVWSKARARR